MKVFTAGFLTESSDLSTLPTASEGWQIRRHGDDSRTQTVYSDSLELWRDLAIAKGWCVAQSICATSFPPGGRTVRTVYENIRETILYDLKKAMPVNGVLLQLHGAATAYGYDDCEGDLIKRVRDIVGVDIPVGVELDPHCHLSDAMMMNATAIIFYKTYLHTDITERADELFQLIAKTMEGFIIPVMAQFNCRMIDLFDETKEPMKSFMGDVYVKEQEEGVLSISPVHGFPFANVEDVGSKMLVITDNDIELARKTAETLGMRFFEARGQMQETLPTDNEVVLKLIREKEKSGELPIRILDFNDFGGGGFPTDNTEMIQAMLSQGMDDLAVGLMWDPLAVSICHDAGKGAELMLRIGGKMTPMSGASLDLKVVIDKLYTDKVITSRFGHIPLGDVAVVHSGKVDFLLVSKRAVGYDIEAFTDLGINPFKKTYLLFKQLSTSEGVVSGAGPNLDPQNWPFDKVDKATMWPWNKDPFRQKS